MDKITDKQMNLMDKLGLQHFERMSRQEASRLIDEKLSKPKMNGKVVKEPQTEFIEASGYRKYQDGDKKSFYVAYSKDLTIALLEFQAELLKAGFIKDLKQLETANEIGKKAVEIIKAIKAEF